MHVEISWVWLGLMLVAFSIEGFTATLCFLLLGFGFFAAALVDGFGFGVPWQLAAVSVGAILAWVRLYAFRERGRRLDLGAQQDPNINPDIGGMVAVLAWGPDQTAQVQYRGSTWQARLARDVPAQPGPHRIIQVIGLELLLYPEGQPLAQETPKIP